MSATIQVPANYGYVLLATTATFFANFAHSVTTGISRKAAKIQYPITYASAEEADKNPAAFKFNCAQRAHANFSENQPSLIGALLISGLQFPLTSASIGAAWVFCRLIYLRGYVKYGPQGRLRGGGFASLFDLSLKCMALYTSVKFILGN